jgi:hypothetical protein
MYTVLGMVERQPKKQKFQVLTFSKLLPTICTQWKNTTKLQQKQTTQFLCDAITSGFHWGFIFSFDGHAFKIL